MSEALSALRHKLLPGDRATSSSGIGLQRRPLLWLSSIAVSLLLLLPVLYLTLRVLQADSESLADLLTTSTLLTLLRTVVLAVAVTGASALIALPLAWLTVRTDLPHRRMWALLTSLPMVIPSYVGAYLIAASLGPRGVLAQWLEHWLGITHLPSIYGFPGAFYVLTLLSYPYTLLSLRAALHGMDPALEEAARGLGKGPWNTFRKVILPQLQPALASGSLLIGLYVLRDFGAVSIMRFNTFTRVIYVQYKSAFDRTTAAGLALILVLLTLVVLIVEARTRARGSYERGPTGSARKPTSIPLGRWRWPALFYCGAVVMASLIIPLGVLLFWLGRGLLAGEALHPLWQSTLNSLTVSALAASVTLLAAIPVVILSVRPSDRWSALPERVAYAAFALPGLVVALALVFFGANYTPWVYQTLPMLILAYLILFLPQAVGALRASLLQVNPSLEEAARGMGRGPLQAFLQVTFPLVRPGAAAGMALVFLTTMKELPATLILSPFDFKTLATSVWSAVSEAFFAQAAAPALLLVVTSSLPMALIVFREAE